MDCATGITLVIAALRPGMANESNLGLHSSIRSPSSAFMGNALAHLSSSVPRALPSPMRVVSNDNNFIVPDSNHSLNDITFVNQCMPNFHPHSLPEYHDSLAHGITSNNSVGLRLTEATDRRHTREMNANGHLMELNGGAFASGNGSSGVRGHHYVLNDSNSYQQHPSSPMMWQHSPSFINGPHAHRFQQMPGFPRTPPHMLNGTSPVRHHVGSAPAVNPSLWERHAFSGQSPDTSSLHLGSPSFACFPSSPQLHPMDVPSRNIFLLSVEIAQT